jgi:hypothetical protein
LEGQPYPCLSLVVLFFVGLSVIDGAWARASFPTTAKEKPRATEVGAGLPWTGVKEHSGRMPVRDTKRLSLS